MAAKPENIMLDIEMFRFYFYDKWNVKCCYHIWEISATFKGNGWFYFCQFIVFTILKLDGKSPTMSTFLHPLFLFKLLVD